jgi:alpha-galactosidase
MQPAVCLLAFFAVPAALALGGQAGRSPVKVFILAGQSNMEGKGSVEHLGELAKTSEYRHLKTAGGQWVVRRDVWIDYLGRKGGLAPGYGGDRGKIGPEFQIGHVLGDHLDNQVLLIKCAWGGKSLYKDFRPPSSGGEVGSYYSQTVARVHEVLGDIRRFFPEYDGRGHEIAGFLWFQGWNDMISGEATAEYEENFANLVRDLRKEFAAPDMPFVIAETGNCGNKRFREAQAAAAARPEFKGMAAFVATEGFMRREPAYDRPYHWCGNAESYCLIGKAMGEAMAKLVPTLNAKDLTSRTKPIFSMIGQMKFAPAHAALVKLEEKLAGESGDEAAREKDLVARMKPMILKKVDAVVEEIKRLDEVGDVYHEKKLITESRPRFKGIERYDETVEPLRKALSRFPKSSEVKRGAQYFYLMGLAAKERNIQVLLALKRLGTRYPKSIYGKAAKAAVKDLQNPDAKVDAMRYLEPSD